MSVSCVSLTLGKLGHGVLFIPFIERRPAYFSSHLRCRQKTTHIKWRSCSNFFWWFALRCLQLCLTIDWRSAFCASIQVARLACVLIGSLAKLSFSFCKQSVLASRRWLMLSLARWSHQWLSFGFKVPLQYLTLSWINTKNEVMLQLSILCCTQLHQVESGVLNHIRFWKEPFAIRVLPNSIASGSEENFCYQSLALLNSIRSWVDPLLLE